MRKSIVSVVLTATLMLFATNVYSQTRTVHASDNYITRKAKVANFHSIQVAGSPGIIYTQTNDEPSIEIYGPDNIVKLIEVILDNGTLIIKYTDNINIKNSKRLDVRLKGPALKSARVRGSGDINFPNGMDTDVLELLVQGSGDIVGKNMKVNSLDLTVMGSGDIKLTDVNASETAAEVKGSGDIAISGHGKKAVFRVAGSGDLDAKNFQVDDVEARVAGSGDISCHANRTLTGGVNGSGDVGYKGNPEITFSRKGLHKL